MLKISTNINQKTRWANFEVNYIDKLILIRAKSLYETEAIDNKINHKLAVYVVSSKKNLCCYYVINYIIIY